MYQNNQQELAQRSCFNPPSYACIREGPDRASRFKAPVNFQCEIFEGPGHCTTLRKAEHAAHEVAFDNLSTRGTSRSLAARVLDETGVYKNLLQETAHRAGLKLPVYTTVRSGPGHQPIFTCSVELGGLSFNGEPAKTKKQAEKNAAMAAWSALKGMPNLDLLQFKDSVSGEEREQVTVERVLSNHKPKDEKQPMRQRRMASPSNAMSFQHQWRFDYSPLTLPPSQGPKILPRLPLSSHELLSSSMVTNNNSTLFLTSRPKNETSDTKGKSVDKEHFVLKSAHEFRPRPSYQRAFPPPYKRTEESDMLFSPRVYPSRMNSTGGPIPRTMSTGGFDGVAPAVCLRSVIPVFAAPPPPSKPSRNTSEIRKIKAEEEILTTTLKLHNIQL